MRNSVQPFHLFRSAVVGLVLFSLAGLNASPHRKQLPPKREPARGEGTGILDPVRRSVVRVVVSPARPDPVRPWVRRPGDAYAVMGLVLGDGLVLIQADDLRNGALVEVSRADSFRKERARPVLIDMEANLAVIRMDRPEFLQGLVPLQHGRDPVQGEEVLACRTDSLFRVYRETARVIEYTISSDYGFTRLPAFLMSTRESYQSGDVLLRDGSLAGIVAYQGQQGKYMVIPVSRLATFRDRALKTINKKDAYAGFVVQGIELDDLVDPRLRAYYGLEGIQGGAYVTSVLPGTPAGDAIRQGDVILKMDGQTVDEKGLYRDPLLGLQKAELLFTRDVHGRYHNPGDRLQVELVRDKHMLKIAVDLHQYSGGAERIPWLISEKQSPYLVETGLVFLELSVPYLQVRFGKDWRVRALELAYVYDSKRHYSEPGQHDHVVILSEVLPDPANAGYQNLGSEVVRFVNGKKIEDLDELIRIMDELRNKPGSIVSIEFSDGKKIFLDPSMKRENERIKKTYRLQELSRARKAP